MSAQDQIQLKQEGKELKKLAELTEVLAKTVIQELNISIEELAVTQPMKAAILVNVIANVSILASHQLAKHNTTPSDIANFIEISIRQKLKEEERQ